MHQNRGNFVIKRLNKGCYERQDETHPARSPLHCFFYLSEGSVLVDIGDATFFIQEDDLVIIPAGQAFKVRYYENSKGYMGAFHTTVAEGFNFVKVWENPKVILNKQGSARIATLLERMCQECEEPNCNERIIKAYLMAFLAETESFYAQGNARVIKHNDSVSNKFLELLFHSKLSTDIRFNPAVTDYAKSLNITPNHLNKVVKAVTGKSPSVWIEEAIIQQSKHLLRTTSLPVGEISELVGCPDQSYFSRKFKKHEGITPREYREK